MKKCLDMKKNGLMKTLKNVITFDNNLELELECSEVGINLHSFKGLMEKGKASENVALEEHEANDNYLMSYTSGTTGDSKGVQLSH